MELIVIRGQMIFITWIWMFMILKDVIPGANRNTNKFNFWTGFGID